MRSAATSVVVAIVVLAGPAALPSPAEAWNIAGYSPQEIDLDGPGPAAVTILGSFSEVMAGYRVKLGKDSQPLHDISAGVSNWSFSQINLTVPPTVGGGLYWVGIYDTGGTLKAKGPRSLVVKKQLNLAPGSNNSLSWQPRPGHTAVGAPELEIVNVLGLPANACAATKYPVSVSVRNNGQQAAKFSVCLVGSTLQDCMGGPPQVFTLNGGATSWFAVFLKPDARYVANGAWRGKLFLGEAENPMQQGGGTPIKMKGSSGSSGTSTTCSTQVSTAPSGGGPGFPGWWLFCDVNMANHLREFTIPSNPEGCPKRAQW